VGDQLHPQPIADFLSAVGVGPFFDGDSVDCAVLGAGLGVRTVVPVPFNPCEAVGVVGGDMDPSPVLVQSDTTLPGLAAGAIALLPRVGEMVLVFLSADVLGGNEGHKKQSKIWLH